MNDKNNNRIIKDICYLTDVVFIIMIVISIRLRHNNLNSLELVSFMNLLTITLLGIFKILINHYRVSNCIECNIRKCIKNLGIGGYILFQEIAICIMSSCVLIINSILYVDKQRYILLLFFIIIYLLAIYIRFSREYCNITIKRCIYVISILSILGLLVISFIWNINTEAELHANSEYTFNNEKNFDLCKRLYNSDKRSYIVLSYSDTGLELRELSNSFTEVLYFDSKEECDKFVLEQTMGKDFYIPVLSGNCSFSKSDLTVSYHPVVDNATRYRLQKKNSVRYFLIFEIYIVLQFLIVAIYITRKNKKSSDT